MPTGFWMLLKWYFPCCLNLGRWAVTTIATCHSACAFCRCQCQTYEQLVTCYPNHSKFAVSNSLPDSSPLLNSWLNPSIEHLGDHRWKSSGRWMFGTRLRSYDLDVLTGATGCQGPSQKTAYGFQGPAGSRNSVSGNGRQGLRNDTQKRTKTRGCCPLHTQKLMETETGKILPKLA